MSRVCPPPQMCHDKHTESMWKGTERAPTRVSQHRSGRRSRRCVSAASRGVAPDPRLPSSGAGFPLRGSDSCKDALPERERDTWPGSRWFTSFNLWLSHDRQKRRFEEGGGREDAQNQVVETQTLEELFEL